jgi:hypothetical protein
MNKPACLATLLLTGALSLPALGRENAAKDEALRLINRGVVLFMAQSSDASCPSTSDKHGPFVDTDSNLAVHAPHRWYIAHGAEPGQAGPDTRDLTDVGSKCFVKDHVSLSVATHPGSCQGCELTNLAGRMTQPVAACCERLRESAAWGGVCVCRQAPA